jgi:hypothetical protein
MAASGHWGKSLLSSRLNPHLQKLFWLPDLFRVMLPQTAQNSLAYFQLSPFGWAFLKMILSVKCNFKIPKRVLAIADLIIKS